MLLRGVDNVLHLHLDEIPIDVEEWLSGYFERYCYTGDILKIIIEKKVKQSRT